MHGLAGMVVANATLIIAIMVYLGWAYENGFYSCFHLKPLNLGISVQDYLFYSLDLFNPIVIFAVVSVITANAVTRGTPLTTAAMQLIRRLARRPQAAAGLKWVERQLPQGFLKQLSKMKSPLIGRLREPRVLLGTLGAAMTVAAITLYRIAGYVPVSTYLLLGLLGCGPLLLTWAVRGSRQGRASYSLAIVVSVVCALWAGSLYADGRGARAAQDFTAGLATQTEVAVYSAQQLALSGPGVTVQKFPAGYGYRYRYEGLRLLYMNSSTYYLLPSQWSPRLSLTYIVYQSDLIWVELY